MSYPEESSESSALQRRIQYLVLDRLGNRVPTWPGCWPLIVQAVKSLRLLSLVPAVERAPGYSELPQCRANRQIGLLDQTDDLLLLLRSDFC